LLKFRGRLQQTWIAGALPKPVQHHRRRENRRRRVRLALTGNVGRRAVARLKHRVGVADIGRGRHSHPADQAGNLIRKNVAEHGFGDQHVEVPGPADQIQGHGVDIVMPCPDRRIGAGDAVEHLAEEGHRDEDIRLVHAGDVGPALFHPRLGAPPGQLEREFVDAFGARARDHHRITRLIIAKPHALAARGEQPFRAFAHENQIDVAGARRGER
jgi:hypothetical protein